MNYFLLFGCNIKSEMKIIFLYLENTKTIKFSYKSYKLYIF